jgi:predicted Zn-dependent peptidase
MAEIAAVTSSDVLRVAQALLDPAQLGLSALGTRRGSDIRPQDLVA